MPHIVVSGALANKPAQGGAAWTRLSWTLGFKRLGYDVYFIEQISPAACMDARGAPCAVDRSANVAYFQSVTEQFGLREVSALVTEGEERSIGLEWRHLIEIADTAEVLINVSGHLTLDALKKRCRRRVFIDLDPGYTQFWHIAGLGEHRLRDHHLYFTVGENIGQSGCNIPTGGIRWRPIRQPVLLDEWPVTEPAMPPVRFTTVASWRGPLGRVTHGSTTFGAKAHEFRRFTAVPTRSSHEFEIALDADPADRRDVEALRANGWKVVSPRCAAADPASFRRYVQQSSAEFSVAQGIYVETQSGWFSDRTVRYLASGKPALVQDTGWSRNYPQGSGLVGFRTLDEAIDGAERIAADYLTHARAARAIAEAFFDSRNVLSQLLKDVEHTS